MILQVLNIKQNTNVKNLYFKQIDNKIKITLQYNLNKKVNNLRFNITKSWCFSIKKRLKKNKYIYLVLIFYLGSQSTK